LSTIAEEESEKSEGSGRSLRLSTKAKDKSIATLSERKIRDLHAATAKATGEVANADMHTQKKSASVVDDGNESRLLAELQSLHARSAGRSAQNMRIPRDNGVGTKLQMIRTDSDLELETHESAGLNKGRRGRSTDFDDFMATTFVSNPPATKPNRAAERSVIRMKMRELAAMNLNAYPDSTPEAPRMGQKGALHGNAESIDPAMSLGQRAYSNPKYNPYPGNAQTDAQAATSHSSLNAVAASSYTATNEYEEADTNGLDKYNWIVPRDSQRGNKQPNPRRRGRVSKPVHAST
jgi:hypothetical protein